MLVIFGFRTYARSLAIVTLVCNRCSNPAAHRVIERVRKFTLFFVPLFPVAKSRSVTCTYCGQPTSISAEQADHYVAAVAGHPAPAMESIPPQPQP